MRTSWQVSHNTVHRTSYQIRINIIIVLITALSSSGTEVYASMTPITASYDRSSQAAWQDWHTPVCNCPVKTYRWRVIWMQMATNGTEHKLWSTGEREPSQKSRTDFMTRHSPRFKCISNILSHWNLPTWLRSDIEHSRVRTRLKLKRSNHYWVCSRSAHGLKKYCLYWNAHV
jgi:hypothetical protein